MIDLLLRIKFENGWVLWFLLVVPVVLVWSLLLRRRAIGFSAVDRATRISPSWRERLLWLTPVIRSLALAALIAGAARPQLGVGRERTITKGVAIMMVLDRSLSMRAEMDYAGERVSRLEGVKRVFSDFVVGNRESGGSLTGRDGDLIGLVGFGAFAETYCPLVREYPPLIEATTQIEYARSNTEAGTAVGDAIALAAARLQSAEEQLRRFDDPDTTEADPEFEIASKVIILLTDGEQNQGDRHPLEGAALAKEWGIKIYTIGLGSDSGGFFGGRGSTVLPRVAELTGGKHFDTADGDGLENIYAEIDALEPTEIERVEFASYREWYHVGAFMALGLIAIDSLLSWVVLRRAI
jgi:Ca-activated chloride channel family protein